MHPRLVDFNAPLRGTWQIADVASEPPVVIVDVLTDFKVVYQLRVNVGSGQPGVIFFPVALSADQILMLCCGTPTVQDAVNSAFISPFTPASMDLHATVD